MKALVIKIQNPTFEAGREQLKSVVRKSCGKYFNVSEFEEIFGSPRFASCFIFRDIFAIGEDEIPEIRPTIRGWSILEEEKIKNYIERLAVAIVQENLGDVEIEGL